MTPITPDRQDFPTAPYLQKTAWMEWETSKRQQVGRRAVRVVMDHLSGGAYAEGLSLTPTLASHSALTLTKSCPEESPLTLWLMSPAHFLGRVRGLPLTVMEYRSEYEPALNDLPDFLSLAPSDEAKATELFVEYAYGYLYDQATRSDGNGPFKKLKRSECRMACLQALFAEDIPKSIERRQRVAVHIDELSRIFTYRDYPGRPGLPWWEILFRSWFARRADWRARNYLRSILLHEKWTVSLDQMLDERNRRKEESERHSRSAGPIPSSPEPPSPCPEDDQSAVRKALSDCIASTVSHSAENRQRALRILLTALLLDEEPFQFRSAAALAGITETQARGRYDHALKTYLRPCLERKGLRKHLLP